METAQTQIKFPVVVALSIFLIISVFILSFLYFARSDKPKSPNQAPIQSGTSAITSAPTPIPTFILSPTPLLGPGPYACDSYGICNIYQDAKGIGCPKTYADLHCLGECGDNKVRCPKEQV